MGAYFFLIHPTLDYIDYLFIGFAMFFLPDLKRRMDQPRLRP